MGENKSGKFDRDRDGGRQALGDVTNQFINRKAVSKRLSGSKRPAENLDDDSHFWKQVSIVVEKLEKETGVFAKCAKVVSAEVGLSSLKGGKTYRLQTGSGNVGSTDENAGSGARDVVIEVKEVCASTLDSIDLGGNQHLTDVVNVEGVVKEDGFLSECCVRESVEIGKESQGEETRGLSDVGEGDCNPEELATHVGSDNGKSSAGDCMPSSRSESPETSRFAESQETRSFGLERCTLLKGDGSDSLGSGMDLIKTCPCSFCAKAAYIWSDLQCQDVKGRLSTLARSQKEASNLARKHSVESPVGVVAQGNSTTAPRSEINLTTLWKSLFVHMENNFAAENNQLQSNFAALKDIREDYKVNLEMINVMPPEMQPCSSDASEF